MDRCEVAASAAQSLFPPGAEVAACLIGAAPPPLPAEAAAIAMAVPARREEFAAGRRAARQALSALGLPAVAIPALESRAPAWPPGITGSIAHADGIAMAVLAPTRSSAALGLDIEPDAPFPEDLVEEVTLPEERDWLRRQSAPLEAARLLFTAKEAAYKCQFPASQTLIGFSALHVLVGSNRRLAAIFTQDVPPFRREDRLYGRYTRAAGLVISGFSRPAAPMRGDPCAP